MSAVERVIAYHIARLQDKNPSVRLASIRELELLDAVGALNALEALYFQEPDETVRQAAQALGRKLYRLKKAQENS